MKFSKSCRHHTGAAAERLFCPSFEIDSHLFSSPSEFCEKAWVLEEKDEGSDGLPHTKNRRQFEKDQYEECEKIVSTYNACRVLVVDELGKDESFCNGQNYFDYCSIEAVEQSDAKRVSMCQNGVVPILIESLQERSSGVHNDPEQKRKRIDESAFCKSNHKFHRSSFHIFQPVLCATADIGQRNARPHAIGA
eukprot:GHVP01049285.1.p1 GENE.GHVP01049285.1~~GHVP01049285.1.p1  ORF type:complete len:193 (-),score=25.80 GHVP01049285.1:386-964(-)